MTDNLFDEATHMTSPFEQNGDIYINGAPVAITATVTSDNDASNYSMLFLMLTLSVSPKNTAQGFSHIFNDINVVVKPRSTQTTKGWMLMETSPSATVGSTTVTSGWSLSLSGNVGFFGKDGTGSVSGAIDCSHSESYAVPDVVVGNNSHLDPDGLDLRVSFDFPAFDSATLDSLPKEAQTSDFEPVVTGVWRVSFADTPPPSVELTIEVDVNYTTLAARSRAAVIGESASQIVAPLVGIGRLIYNLFTGHAATSSPPVLTATPGKTSCTANLTVKLPGLPPTEPSLDRN